MKRYLVIIALFLISFPVFASSDVKYEGNKPLYLKYGFLGATVCEEGNSQGFDLYSQELKNLLSKNPESTQALNDMESKQRWALLLMIPAALAAAMVFEEQGYYLGKNQPEPLWLDLTLKISSAVMLAGTYSLYVSAEGDLYNAVHIYNKSIGKKDISLKMIRDFTF